MNIHELSSGHADLYRDPTEPPVTAELKGSRTYPHGKSELVYVGGSFPGLGRPIIGLTGGDETEIFRRSHVDQETHQRVFTVVSFSNPSVYDVIRQGMDRAWNRTAQRNTSKVH